MDSYIYIIQSPNRMCYVGQATDTNKVDSEAQGVPYDRIYQHVHNTYSNAVNAKTDASVPIFAAWPLKYLELYVYRRSENYGLDISVYENFLKFFTPAGRQKVAKGGKIKNIRQSATGLVIQLQNGEQQALTEGEMIDIAEIVWLSRKQKVGFNICNKVIGGQTSAWVFHGLNGDEPININTTPPSVLTSMLISTDASSLEQAQLLNFQQDLDNLFKKYLTKDVGALIENQVKKDANSKKNLLRGRDFSLKPILQKAVASVLTSSEKSPHIEQFNAELDVLLNKYSTIGLDSFNYSIESTDTNKNAILESITQKIANSMLERFQSTRLKSDWTYNLQLNYNGEGVISYKGKGGKDIGSATATAITVPIDQTLSIHSKKTKRGASWWYSPTSRSKEQVSLAIRWEWTRKVFNYFIQYLKVPDKDCGTLFRAKKGDWTGPTNGVVVVTPKDKKETLSAKMLEAYREKLSYHNDILHNWQAFFSRLYSIGSATDWDFQTDEEGDFLAVIVGQTLADEDTGEEYMIGISIEDTESFDLEKSPKAYSDIIF